MANIFEQDMRDFICKQWEHLEPIRRKEFALRDEAKTSFFVAPCLETILGYSLFDEIVPQSSHRGFIDYALHLGEKHRTSCWVEVKRFDERLSVRPHDDQLRNYLMRNRGHSRFIVGIFTNLREWKCFGYSPGVGPRNPVELLAIDIPRRRKRHTFAHLKKHIGHEVSKKGFPSLRKLYGENPAVVTHRLFSKEIYSSVRTQLQKNRNVRKRNKQPGRKYRGPNNAALKLMLRQVLKGKTWQGSNDDGITRKEAVSALVKGGTELLASMLSKGLNVKITNGAIGQTLRRSTESK